MQTYRVTFRLDVPSLSLWQADALFGHLCWALVRREGEEALANLLALCKAGRPPVLLSDGFPPDAFPRPLLAPTRLAPTGNLPTQIAMARRAKAARDCKWLDGEEFARILQGLPPEDVITDPLSVPRKDYPFLTLHNQINRETGTTTGVEEGTGNLYAVIGELFVSRVFYLRIADDIAFDWQELLHDVVQTGFGKRKSVGYGAIASCQIEPFAGFGEPADANGFVSLSAFVPAATDPTDGYWRTEVKYGKLGEEYANGVNPFKRPLLRLLAGAVFYEPGPVRRFYGRLVEGIAPAVPEVAQYGFAFAVPIRLPIRETEVN